MEAVFGRELHLFTFRHGKRTNLGIDSAALSTVVVPVTASVPDYASRSSFYETAEVEVRGRRGSVVR